MHNQLVDAVADTWEEGAEPAVRLERLIEEMLARVDDSPAFFRLALVTQGAPSGSDAVGSELALIGLAVAGLIRDLVVDGIERGEFRPIDPDLAITLIGQQLYGAMAVRAEEPDPPDRSQAAADTVRFILHGLSA
jgi:AcrR family transcriptional regulator